MTYMRQEFANAVAIAARFATPFAVLTCDTEVTASRVVTGSWPVIYIYRGPVSRDWGWIEQQPCGTAALECFGRSVLATVRSLVVPKRHMGDQWFTAQCGVEVMGSKFVSDIEALLMWQGSPS